MAKQKHPAVKKAKPCLHCKNKAKSRGCCDTCRIAIFGKITRGEFTEQEAVESGWLLARKPLGRKAKNGFAKKFEQSKKKSA